jgi:hypothetical protein
MAHLKRSIIEVKANENCLAYALLVAIAKIRNNPNYKSYRQGYKIRPAVQALLEETVIELRDGGGLYLNSLDSRNTLQNIGSLCIRSYVAKTLCLMDRSRQLRK